MGIGRTAFTALAALTLLVGGVFATQGSQAAEVGALDFATAEAGNPFADGWYAGPGAMTDGDTSWVFAASAPASTAAASPASVDAFASRDLTHWEKHPGVLSAGSIAWARGVVSAPAPIEHDGRYYLYFAAGDLESHSRAGGIGVAVADRPGGPYADALGRPLIDRVVNAAQPSDPAVFRDDDGQVYLYYGGWGRANVVKLNADLISLGRFAEGRTQREITPPGFTEGAQVFKRSGRYYLAWAGGWYAVATRPAGPFRAAGKLIEPDPAVATGPLSRSAVLNVAGTDLWYLVYDRRPLSEFDPAHRTLSYDRMSFAADGSVRPVTMRVHDDFADGNALGWRIYGGSWSVSGGRFAAAASPGGKALLDTGFADLVLTARVSITGGAGDAGVVFRVTRPHAGAGSFRGYYAGLTTAGEVVLAKAAGTWTPLASAPIAAGGSHRLRVTAVGPAIKVYVDDARTPALSVTDPQFRSGTVGLRTAGTAAAFDTVAVSRP